MAPDSGVQQVSGTGGRHALLTGSGPQVAMGPGSGPQVTMGPGSGPQVTMGPGSGPQVTMGPGSGPQVAMGPGSGPQVAMGPGSGPQMAMGPGSGPQVTMGPGSGPQVTMGPGSGPQVTMGPGSGPQVTVRSGSGPQPAADRTPVRGYPPVLSGPPGRERPEPPQDALGAWYMPGTSFAGEDDRHADGEYAGGQYAGGGYAHGRYPDAGYADAGYADGGYADGEYADGHWDAGEDEGGEHPGAAELDDPASVAPAAPRRGERTARTRRRSSRLWLLAAAAVVALAAGGFAGYKYLYEPRVDAPVAATLRLPTTAPGSSDFDQALGKWQHIGTRAEDPQPLTLQQLYPPQFQLDGLSYVRTAASATTNCPLAVFGSQLQTALQSGHCSQVLRASYISGGMMGTIGVVNLISSTAAQQAGKVTGPQEIIAPLSASKGATSKLGSGTGVVQAEIKGHYLILMWAEFTSLKSPSATAQKQQLEQFATRLVTGSANIDLSTRMLTGKA